jgi:hypothetical protein
MRVDSNGVAYLGGAGVGMPLPPTAVDAGSAGALVLTAGGAVLEPPLQPVSPAVRPKTVRASVNKRPMLRVRFITCSWKKCWINNKQQAERWAF